LDEPQADLGGDDLATGLDLPAARTLLECFSDITGMPASITDLSGNVLVATGWQDVCTRFHRLHPITSGFCVENDARLSRGLGRGEFREHMCPNGLRDMAASLYVGDSLSGRVHIGQFLYDDESLDIERFHSQAARYGFDIEEYLAAVRAVPRYSRDRVRSLMTHLVGLAELVSRLSLANEGLKNAEQRYRELYERSPVGYQSLDAQGRFLDVNRSWLEMLGYESDEVIGKWFGDFLVPDMVEAFRERFPRFVAAGKTTTEFEMRRKDGRTVTVAFDGTIGYEEDGTFKQTHCVLTDITERRKNEEELRKQKDFYELILNRVNDGIWVTDGDDRMIYLNPGMERIAGVEADEVLGLSVTEDFPPETTRYFIQHYARAKSTGTPQPYEAEVVTPAGRPTVQSGWLLPRFNEGRFEGMICTIQDVTERRMAEAELRERDDQLRQSQKMEAVGQLAGGIAHDFNNLLTAIIGYSDLILSGAENRDPGVRGDVKEIKRAADRASALTRQILAFSRRQALAPTPASLNDIVRGMQSLLQRTLGEDVEVVIMLHADLGHVEVDVHQFEQVLMNLALNARDAMPAGGTLTLETGNLELDEEYCRTHPDAEPGSYVVLSVSDTGVGMDPEVQSRVFEPFFTTKAPGQGTGLGLATVYGIVRQSGGSVGIDSEPGRGTTFRVFLPRIARATAVSPPPSSTVSTRGHETILVVEDEASVRKLVTRILEGLGYRLLQAATAPEALDVMEGESRPIDLLLTDVVLPGEMQGNDLAGLVQSAEPRLPVLYVSGYTRDAIVHSGRLDEGVNYLEKPFTPDALALKVREVLDASLRAGSDES